MLMLKTTRCVASQLRPKTISSRLMQLFQSIGPITSFVYNTNKVQLMPSKSVPNRKSFWRQLINSLKRKILLLFFFFFFFFFFFLLFYFLPTLPVLPVLLFLLLLLL